MKKIVNKHWVVVPLFCVGFLAPPTLSAHSLAQAVQLALTHNPEVLSAQQGIGIAEEQLGQARAGWRPTIDLTMDMGREYKNKDATDPTAMTKNISSLTLNQPLYDGGATSASVERSDLMQHVSVIHFDEVRTATALKAIEAWHELFRLQRVIKLTEANVGEHRQLFIQIKQKVDAGGAGRAELVAAETPWLLAQSALIEARGDYQDALAKYTKVVGVEPVEILVSGLNINGEQMPQALTEAVERLLQDNFILRTAEANLMAARADHRGARAGLLPTLGFELKGGRKQNDGGDEGVDLDTTALIKLNYNLYNGGADESRRRETARAVIDSQEQLSLAHRNMLEQLTQYWNGLEVSRQLLNTSHQQYKIAQENHLSAQEQFKLGEGDVMAIMAASDAELVAKKAVLGDEIDLHLGRYQLLSHMGQLLNYVQAADVMVVMGQLQAVEVAEGKMGWVDQLVAGIGGEPLLNDPVRNSSAEVVMVEQPAVQTVVTTQWDGAYSQMRDAGWVVFNAMDEIDGVSGVRAPAPAQPVVEQPAVSNMVMVGGDSAEGSAAFRHNRAERRRVELQKRLGRYSRESSRYQRRLEQQRRRLGSKKHKMEVASARINRNIALRNLMAR